VLPGMLMACEQTAGKRVGIFGLPGAFMPTGSAKHVPGYVEPAEKLRAAGLDEIWSDPSTTRS
jgi:peroxiredoxin